jgi:acyl carrier protein
MESHTQELRQFIIDNFLFGDQSGRFTFSNTDSLQELGIVDSTGVLELVCHLQERYAIAVADEDLIPDNLDSIEQIDRFIERKRRDVPMDPASLYRAS